MKSVERWILIIKGIHEGAQEDDLFDAFSKYSTIKNLHLNLDRCQRVEANTIISYVLVEFSEFTHAQDALNGVNKSDVICCKKVQVDCHQKT